MTKMSSPMAPTSTSLTLKNAASFRPASDSLLIGEEVVIYDGGNVLRGQRLRSYAHQKGT